MEVPLPLTERSPSPCRPQQICQLASDLRRTVSANERIPSPQISQLKLWFVSTSPSPGVRAVAVASAVPGHVLAHGLVRPDELEGALCRRAPDLTGQDDGAHDLGEPDFASSAGWRVRTTSLESQGASEPETRKKVSP